MQPNQAPWHLSADGSKDSDCNTVLKGSDGLPFQLSCYDPVVSDKICVDGFESFLTQQHGNLGTMVGGMVHQMNHNHFNVIGIILPYIVLVGHFPIEVFRGIDKIQPLR